MSKKKPSAKSPDLYSERSITANSQTRHEPTNFLLLSRLSDDEIWAVTHVNKSTISRCRNGKTRMDYATEQLLRYVAFGYIPHGFKDWAGFYFGKGGKFTTGIHARISANAPRTGAVERIGRYAVLLSALRGQRPCRVHAKPGVTAWNRVAML